MKNKLKGSISSALILLALCSSTAFAANTYKDVDSGYSVTTADSSLRIVGRDFYTNIVQKDTDKGIPGDMINMVMAIPNKDASEAVGGKFSTADFMKQLQELQVLERAKIGSKKQGYKAFDLSTYVYTHKDNKVISMLPKSLVDKADYKLSTGKIGNRAAAFITFVTKPQPKKTAGTAQAGTKEGSTLEEKAVDFKIGITSDNDMLYTLVNAYPVPKLSTEKSKEATVFTKKKAAAGEKADLEAIKAGLESQRTKYFKDFKTMKPVEDKVHFGIRDSITNTQIALPNDWVYGQMSEAEKAEGLSFTIAAPIAAMKTAQEKAMGIDMEQVEEDTKTRNVEAARNDSYEPFFALMNNSLFTVGVYDKGSKEFAEYLERPMETKMMAEALINTTIGSKRINEMLKVNSLKYDIDITKSLGQIKLDTDFLLKGKFNYFNTTKLSFTKNKLGLVLLNSDKALDPNSDLVKAVREYQLK